MIIISKTCTICKQTKPASEFHKQAGLKDGLRNDCKECITAKYKKGTPENVAMLKEKEEVAQLIVEDKQECKICAIVKPFLNFTPLLT